MKRVFYIILCISFMGCSGSTDDSNVISPTEHDDIAIEDIDTVMIETPGTSREFPYLFPSLDYSEEHFVGLDERTGSINIYNLPELTHRTSIPLHQEGPHEIQKNMIGAIYYHNNDSIFILQHIPYRLLIINDDSEIIWRLDLKDEFSKEPAWKDWMAYGWFDRIGIYFKNNKLYFAIGQNLVEKDYTQPMVGYYDFDAHSVSFLDISYPDFFTSDGLIGYYNYPGITFFQDEIIITYPYSSEIFIYDLEGHLKKSITSLPNMKTGKTQAPDEETMAHFQANPFYMEVKPIQNGKYFLRHGNDPEPDDPENTVYKYTILYNSDFTKYSIIRKNEKPVSFGGEYIYYPLAQEVSEYQLLERYKIRMD